MRKAIILCVAGIIITLATYLVYRVFATIQQKKAVEKNTAILPVFSFRTLNNKTFSHTDLENANDKIIFNHFSPTCEHCQYMAKSFLANKDKLKDVTILMVTIADSTSVAKFSNEYQLATMPNIILLRDTKYQFEKTFGTSVVPSFFIYQNTKLVKKIIGETKIDNLLAP
jgi:thiol-disulfide isomerase/thioredoxin